MTLMALTLVRGQLQRAGARRRRRRRSASRTRTERRRASSRLSTSCRRRAGSREGRASRRPPPAAAAPAARHLRTLRARTGPGAARPGRRGRAGAPARLEVAARPGGRPAGRAPPRRVRRGRGRFSASAGRPTLGAFLAWLAPPDDRERGLEPGWRGPPGRGPDAHRARRQGPGVGRRRRPRAGRGHLPGHTVTARVRRRRAGRRRRPRTRWLDRPRRAAARPARRRGRPAGRPRGRWRPRPRRVGRAAAASAGRRRARDRRGAPAGVRRRDPRPARAAAHRARLGGGRTPRRGRGSSELPGHPDVTVGPQAQLPARADGSTPGRWSRSPAAGPPTRSAPARALDAARTAVVAALGALPDRAGGCRQARRRR